jgi:hypothetical protein
MAKRMELTRQLTAGRTQPMTTVYRPGSTILKFITETFACPLDSGTDLRKDPISVLAPTPTILAETTSKWFWRNPALMISSAIACIGVRNTLVRLSKLHPAQPRINVAAGSPLKLCG